MTAEAWDQLWVPRWIIFWRTIGPKGTNDGAWSAAIVAIWSHTLYHPSSEGGYSVSGNSMIYLKDMVQVDSYIHHPFKLACTPIKLEVLLSTIGLLWPPSLMICLSSFIILTLQIPPISLYTHTTPFRVSYTHIPHFSVCPMHTHTHTHLSMCPIHTHHTFPCVLYTHTTPFRV